LIPLLGWKSVSILPKLYVILVSVSLFSRIGFVFVYLVMREWSEYIMGLGSCIGMSGTLQATVCLFKLVPFPFCYYVFRFRRLPGDFIILLFRLAAYVFSA
jgi:hypothetical protein